MSDANTLIRLVKHGPTKADGTALWLLGHMVWWRMLATLLLISAPLFVGLAVLAEVNGYWAVIATAIAYALTSEWQYQVNPKYELEKNY